MTEEIKEEDTISNQVFNNWKNHDCTKALIGIIDDCVCNLEKLALEKCLEENKELKPECIYFLRGGKKIAEEIKGKLLSKNDLEKILNNTEEENVNA